MKPVKPFPLVFSKDELPATDYANIYFPANLVAVNRDGSFGQEHDTAVVNLGKFFPNESPADTTKGTELTVNSIGLDIGYSGSNDVTPPLITQVGAVNTGGTTFTAFVRVSDASGLARVAVFYTTGAHDWTVQPLTNAGGGLWTATFDAGAILDQARRGGAGRGRQRRLQLQQGRQLPVCGRHDRLRRCSPRSR